MATRTSSRPARPAPEAVQNACLVGGRCWAYSTPSLKGVSLPRAAPFSAGPGSPLLRFNGLAQSPPAGAALWHPGAAHRACGSPLAKHDRRVSFSLEAEAPGRTQRPKTPCGCGPAGAGLQRWGHPRFCCCAMGLLSTGAGRALAWADQQRLFTEEGRQRPPGFEKLVGLGPGLGDQILFEPPAAASENPDP